jgi:hypothetical protein
MFNAWVAVNPDRWYLILGIVGQNRGVVSFQDYLEGRKSRDSSYSQRLQVNHSTIVYLSIFINAFSSLNKSTSLLL